MLQPSSQAARHTEEVLQRHFELDKTRRQQATNLGRRSNIVSHTPDKVLPLPVLPPQLTTYPNCSFTALCECSAEHSHSDSWFDTVTAYNFATTADFLHCLKADTRAAFLQKVSQSVDMPRNLKEQYLKCYQSICASMQGDPTPMSTTRVSVFETSFRTDCASAR